MNAFSIRLLLFWFLPLLAFSARALEYRTTENISYVSAAQAGDDAYRQERCVLDLYVPIGTNGFATVVWFHGGGLTGGSKEVPKELRQQGLAVVGVNYRLSPKVPVKGCIEDAAAAVAWTLAHMAEFGGDPAQVFVSGHSAGGYLTLMIGLDQSWLAAQGADANALAGLIPFSGHTITHFTARKELGIPKEQPMVNQMAPLFHVRKDAPPLLLITGDREKEMLGRYEENAYLWRMMKVNRHAETTLVEIPGTDHGGMVSPAFALLLDFVRAHKKTE